MLLCRQFNVSRETTVFFEGKIHKQCLICTKIRVRFLRGGAEVGYYALVFKRKTQFYHFLHDLNHKTTKKLKYSGSNRANSGRLS